MSNSPDFLVILFSWFNIQPPQALEAKLANPNGKYSISIFCVFLLCVVGECEQ